MYITEYDFLTDCSVPRKSHDHHDCCVTVTARIMVSNPTKWTVVIKGSHVPDGEDDNWAAPAGNKKIAESVKDQIMGLRDVNMKPYEVFRHQIRDIPEEEMKTAFSDTRFHPTDQRIGSYIKNTERRHSFKGGQWTAVHNIAVTELKREGILLFLQNGTEGHDRKGFVMAVSNKTALASARKNSPIIGIDGKHGLQDDGACLMTAVTQHKDGFGCPVSFTIMNREYSENICLALKAILDNVPCPDELCEHPFTYIELPDGWRRVTPCSSTTSYTPMVMIDKFEASVNACLELHLTYILCWFHVVKAIMEKLRQLDISIDSSYIVILAFKLVARSGGANEAEHRWSLFIEVSLYFICCNHLILTRKTQSQYDRKASEM
jgi:hypothetical protein